MITKSSFAHFIGGDPSAASNWRLTFPAPPLFCMRVTFFEMQEQVEGIDGSSFHLYPCLDDGSASLFIPRIPWNDKEFFSSWTGYGSFLLFGTAHNR
jgi:hypothetical protein